MNKTENTKSPLLFQSELSIILGDNYRITRNRIEILLAIEKTGSISQAAKKVGMSYKGVWDAIYQMQNLSGMELVLSKTGGKGGGGAALSDAGKTLVRSFLKSEKTINGLMANLDPQLGESEEFFRIISRISVKTSARNQLSGKIEELNIQKINTRISIRISPHILIHTQITNESTKELELTKGKMVTALIKAPHVRVWKNRPDSETENLFEGRVMRILSGDGYTEVHIRLEGGFSLTSSMIENKFRDLDIEEDRPLYCSIDPSDILIGVV